MANNFSGFPNSLGAWSTDNLLETYTKTGTIGADDNLPQEIRFLGGVAKLIRKRLAVENAKSDPSCPAIFLLKPNGPAHKSKEPTHVPMLDNGLTPITGRLWYLSPVVITGRYIDIGDYENDAELFQIIVDELKLGTIPAIIFDPRPGEPEIRFYKNGLSDAEVVDVILINRAQISLDNIFSTINDVYKKFLVTPDAQPEAGKLWVEPAKCWPIKNAENTIQLYLKIGLTMAFPTCVVRHEQTDVSGRLDLEIEESDPLNRSLITRHAILELKVLRSFGSTGKVYSEDEILGWIEAGVKQAAAYRNDRGALASALCCFDMRQSYTGDKCFNDVKDLAEKLQVALKLWFLFSTSKEFRDTTISI